MSDDL
jgi:hypothetical protein